MALKFLSEGRGWPQICAHPPSPRAAGREVTTTYLLQVDKEVLIFEMAALLCFLALLLLHGCSAFFLGGARLVSSGAGRMALCERLVRIRNLDSGQEITIESGKPMSLACTRANLRLSFQCKQGTCQSCEFLLDGKKTRSCITKVPDKAVVTIQKK